MVHCGSFGPSSNKLAVTSCAVRDDDVLTMLRRIIPICLRRTSNYHCRGLYCTRTAMKSKRLSITGKASSRAPERDKPATQGINSVEIGLKVIRAIVDSPLPLNLTSIATNTGLTTSSAFRYLTSFQRAGLIERRPFDGNYQLGTFAVEVGLAALGRIDSQQVAYEEMIKLRDAVEQTVALNVWNGHHSVVVRWVESAEPVMVNVKVGSALSVVRSPTGRLFAAYRKDNQIALAVEEEFASGAVFTHMGKVFHQKDFAPMLEEIRKRGLDRVQGDLVPGVDSICAPVFDQSGAIVMVITALGSRGNIDISWSGEVAAAVRRAGAAISERLGYKAGSRRQE